MTILLGSAVPELPSVEAFAPPRMGSTWTGWDGSVWDLLTYADSGVLLMRGVRGLGKPTHDRYSSQSPALAGSRWRGYRTTEREVFWPVAVYADTANSRWVATDRAFWRTMHPGRPGTWTITQPSGEVRSLVCRFVDDGAQVFDVDPLTAGWTAYGVTLVADEQPFWSGQTITRTFRASAASDFYGGSGGPPFYISSASTLASAAITNPGDVEAYPVWTITGPTTSVSVGLAGNLVDVPFTLATGVSLVIDSRPTAQTAVDSLGVERTAELGSANFAAIPPGESVPLTLTMAGTGIVQVDLTPLYDRAW